ncbi:Hsp70 family protein, partial [Candidatus Woesearchaeota archaeon]|nr:Hsp70 family protein [Candidatus Woesearchaeota archaeon]
ERPMAADNKLLGQFDLVGIPPAPRGIPQIDVAFDIDANGIVHVTAKDLGTGKSQSVKITAEHKLSEAEIQKMKRESEEYAETDRQKKEEAEAINEADALVYSSDKLASEMKGKVDESHLEKIKSLSEELKGLLGKKERDITSIKQKSEELNKAVQEASIELYKKAQASTNAQAEEKTETDKKERVVDADFKEAEKP